MARFFRFFRSELALCLFGGFALGIAGVSVASSHQEKMETTAPVGAISVSQPLTGSIGQQ